ncbi:MAG: VOC family protein [Pseudomonadota bacterium]|nr:VOC family protein [Pseudomonadota bacterium]
MRLSLDHVHVFASDVAATLDFLEGMLGGRVIWDRSAAGVRNVRVRIGAGFVHVYDQPPRGARGGAVHHLGIETDNLDAVVLRMKHRGFNFRNPVREDPNFRYVMIAGPDDLLIEIFEARDPGAWEIAATSGTPPDAS